MSFPCPTHNKLVTCTATLCYLSTFQLCCQCLLKSSRFTANYFWILAYQSLFNQQRLETQTLSQQHTSSSRPRTILHPLPPCSLPSQQKELDLNVPSTPCRQSLTRKSRQLSALAATPSPPSRVGPSQQSLRTRQSLPQTWGPNGGMVVVVGGGQPGARNTHAVATAHTFTFFRRLHHPAASVQLGIHGGR